MASGNGAVQSRQLLKQLSHQSSSESIVGEELDLLTNVYFDDLQIVQSEKGSSLSLHVTPSTADDKEKQFVYLDLNILLPPKYPQVGAVVSLSQSRGLSDAHLRGISEGLALKCSELLGSPMVYELVEYARDCLTDNNLPCSRCAICQGHFQEGDDFTKTECYHYLHVTCLARYVEFFERERREMEREAAMMDTMLRKKPKQLECPVCRDPISPGSMCLDAIARSRAESLHREDEEINFKPSPELKAWQDRMASLLWKQRQKGGVVNLSNEDDVIDESWVSSASRKQGSEIGEDGEGVTLDERRANKCSTGSSESDNVDKKVTEAAVVREVPDAQGDDRERSDNPSTLEKPEAKRKEQENRNGRTSKKRGYGQNSGFTASEKISAKPRWDQERDVERTSLPQRRKENGRRNGRHGQSRWREERHSEQGQCHSECLPNARRGNRREHRGQRSKRASGGQASKLCADSAKERIPGCQPAADERYNSSSSCRDAVQLPRVDPGARVRVKTRFSDAEETSHESRYKSELQ